MLTITGVIIDYLGSIEPQHVLTLEEHHELLRACNKGQLKAFDKDKKIYMVEAVFDSSSSGREYTVAEATGAFQVLLVSKEVKDDCGDISASIEVRGAKDDVKSFLDLLHAGRGALQVYSLRYTLNRIPYYARPIYAPEFFGHKIFDYVDTRVRKFLQNQDFYERTGLPYRIGFCFAGEKGLGKTQMAYALARYYKLGIVEVNPIFDFTKISEGQIDLSNKVVLLDDIDLFPCSQSRKIIEATISTNIGEKKSYQQLKALMKFLEASNVEKTIFIATTNHPETLETALLRSGRLDHLLEFEEIQNREITEIMERFYPDFPESSLINVNISPIKISDLIHQHILPHVDDFDGCLLSLMNR